ncbi:UPF0728 protein C10orf53 homolog [Xiphias gladius]|uniref:UPF0728 protein C10orf53 homolog n=1 Tax=Xiphias gladius TaxID=8245 RepID=UPI001A99A069|nr:UPF0728 protein C10orf53 homolog [Xiphias gladius]
MLTYSGADGIPGPLSVRRPRWQQAYCVRVTPVATTNARVTLGYGPHESSGVVQHGPFRLQGLQRSVSAAAPAARGHRRVLEEVRDRNTVELAVNGELVFTCQCGDGKLDRVCNKAFAAVEDAY